MSIAKTDSTALESASAQNHGILNSIEEENLSDRNRSTYSGCKKRYSSSTYSSSGDSVNSSETSALDPYREGTFKQIIRDKNKGRQELVISGMAMVVVFIVLCSVGAARAHCHKESLAGKKIDVCNYLIEYNDGEGNPACCGLIWGVCLLLYVLNKSGWWITQIFFKIIPSISLMYFLPGVLHSCSVFGDGPSGDLYHVASNYFLPVVLVLLCLSCDIVKIMKLGWRSILMFLTGTFGVVVGGPLAILFFRGVAPSVVCGDNVWRVLAYLAGSWIGGSANATAMLDIFNGGVQNNAEILSAVIIVDTVGGLITMIVCFSLVEKSATIDDKMGADRKPLLELIDVVDKFERETARNPTAADLLIIVGFAFMVMGTSVGVGNVLADGFDQVPGTTGDLLRKMAFNNKAFWRVMLATIAGVLASFTPLRKLDCVGATKVATVLLYFVILTIGMQVNIAKIVENPGLFGVGVIWITILLICLVVMSYLIKAPVFYAAIGCTANVGGAGSAPVVAAAFHPCLAPVGVLFGIFGYIIGTWAGYICVQLMRVSAPKICH